MATMKISALRETICKVYNQWFHGRYDNIEEALQIQEEYEDLLLQKDNESRLEDPWLSKIDTVRSYNEIKKELLNKIKELSIATNPRIIKKELKILDQDLEILKRVSQQSIGLQRRIIDLECEIDLLKEDLCILIQSASRNNDNTNVSNPNNYNNVTSNHLNQSIISNVANRQQSRYQKTSFASVSKMINNVQPKQTTIINSKSVDQNNLLLSSELSNTSSESKENKEMHRELWTSKHDETKYPKCNAESNNMYQQDKQRLPEKEKVNNLTMSSPERILEQQKQRLNPKDNRHDHILNKDNNYSINEKKLSNDKEINMVNDKNAESKNKNEPSIVSSSNINNNSNHHQKHLLRKDNNKNKVTSNNENMINKVIKDQVNSSSNNDPTSLSRNNDNSKETNRITNLPSKESSATSNVYDNNRSTINGSNILDNKKLITNYLNILDKDNNDRNDNNCDKVNKQASVSNIVLPSTVNVQSPTKSPSSKHKEPTSAFQKKSNIQNINSHKVNVSKKYEDKIIIRNENASQIFNKKPNMYKIDKRLCNEEFHLKNNNCNEKVTCSIIDNQNKESNEASMPTTKIIMESSIKESDFTSDKESSKNDEIKQSYKVSIESLKVIESNRCPQSIFSVKVQSKESATSTKKESSSFYVQSYDTKVISEIDESMEKSPIKVNNEYHLLKMDLKLSSPKVKKKEQESKEDLIKEKQSNESIVEMNNQLINEPLMKEENWSRSQTIKKMFLISFSGKSQVVNVVSIQNDNLMYYQSVESKSAFKEYQNIVHQKPMAISKVLQMYCLFEINLRILCSSSYIFDRGKSKKIIIM